MAAPSGSAIRALGLEYKSLCDEPMEGFRMKMVNEEDMFLWEVALFGPPDTLYQGGYFKVRLLASWSLISGGVANQSYDLTATSCTRVQSWEAAYEHCWWARLPG